MSLSARKDRLSDKKDVSGRIGETSRFIGFGLIALVFTIHGSESQFARGLRSDSAMWINLAGLFGCLIILFDYLQYLCGYFSVNEALRRENDDFKYDPKSYPYIGRVLFFWAKQLAALVGVVLILVAITKAIFWASSGS